MMGHGKLAVSPLRPTASLHSTMFDLDSDLELDHVAYKINVTQVF